MKAAFQDWNDAIRLAEVRAMLDVSWGCHALIPMFEVIREKNCDLYFVFEYMPDGTLNDLISKTREQRSTIDFSTIRNILHQVLQGVQHIHGKGYMHRDLKPENLLMRGTECKVADFSLTRGVRSAERQMTTYVSTRWYRAPEIILCDPKYGAKADIFALGCILAELYRLVPLFPGETELEQLQRYLSVLGKLEDADWPEGELLSKRFGLKPSSTSKTLPIQRLQHELPTASGTAVSLVCDLLRLNPKLRPTASDALKHEYFRQAENAEETSAGTNIVTTPRKMVPSTSRLPLVSVSPTFRNLAAFQSIDTRPAELLHDSCRKSVHSGDLLDTITCPSFDYQRPEHIYYKRCSSSVTRIDNRANGASCKRPFRTAIYEGDENQNTGSIATNIDKSKVPRITTTPAQAFHLD